MEGGISSPEIQTKTDLSAPYVTAIKAEAKNKIPGHERSLDIVFGQINRQAIDNFQINKSERFPGVEFSSIKLEVTKELVETINPSLAKEQNSEGPQKHLIYFLQPAWGLPPGGNAFSVLDVGIDRFIREIPKVAQALRKGEVLPKIDIYLIGAPMSFGGRVTPEWVEALKKEGLTAEGKLNAEFVEGNIPKDPKELANTTIILQGVSKGAVTASETSKNLPADLKSRVRRLYDIPAANHARNILSRIVKGANLVTGLIGEQFVRGLGKEFTAKVLTAEEKPFYQEMAKRLGIPEDDQGQQKLKSGSFKAETSAIFKGNPFDTSERTFIRAPEFDPVNFNVANFVRILTNSITERKKFLAFGKGKTITFPTSRKAHFFVFKKSFKRWEKNLQFAEGSST